ncbi:MAG TPA: hypothetical protein VLG40_04110 [Candidatus Saccharimonas sp.]|nr:hypothetical protein [Candidatus Saccharimonas sp.]
MISADGKVWCPAHNTQGPDNLVDMMAAVKDVMAGLTKVAWNKDMFGPYWVTGSFSVGGASTNYQLHCYTSTNPNS